MTTRLEMKVKRLAAWSRYLDRKTEEAQVELIETYRPMVAWMAWKDYGWRCDLEDVIDCGMLGVFEATQKMDIKRVKSVDAYVSMVARSRMINYCQRMMHRDVQPEEGDIFTMAFEDEETLGSTVIGQKILEALEYTDHDQRLDIDDAIEDLPSKERLVLKLRFWGGWQMKEIAELLKCSTPNVWYIEKQALAKIENNCYTPA